MIGYPYLVKHLFAAAAVYLWNDTWNIHRETICA